MRLGLDTQPSWLSRIEDGKGGDRHLLMDIFPALCCLLTAIIVRVIHEKLNRPILSDFCLKPDDDPKLGLAVGGPSIPSGRPLFRSFRGKPLGYLDRTLSSQFSSINWLDGSISAKAIPIPYFGLEYITLPEAAKEVPPRIIRTETFVPCENGFPVST